VLHNTVGCVTQSEQVQVQVWSSGSTISVQGADTQLPFVGSGLRGQLCHRETTSAKSVTKVAVGELLKRSSGARELAGPRPKCTRFAGQCAACGYHSR
jgi:hypothetical protein